MRIADEYSYKNAKELIDKHYAPEMQDIRGILGAITEKGHRSPTGNGKLLPGALKRTFKSKFGEHGWDRQRVKVEMLNPPKRAIYREIDFVKNRLGVDLQFGKVALIGYSITHKMPIFHDEDVIDVGIEIVAIKDLAAEMSSGVAYFEQLVWDLEHRGVADVDIPVLVVGVAL
jgi:hypothetical protein